MNKVELLEKMRSLLIREEETVNALAKFYLVLRWERVVQPQYKDKITAGLTTLRDDTQRHMDILTKLLEKVESREENGF